MKNMEKVRFSLLIKKTDELYNTAPFEDLEYHELCKMVYEIRHGNRYGAYDANIVDERCLELIREENEQSLEYHGL